MTSNTEIQTFDRQIDPANTFKTTFSRGSLNSDNIKELDAKNQDCIIEKDEVALMIEEIDDLIKIVQGRKE